ncbi:DUF4062 domain-containing protein [Micromonospora zhanjiangensis]|uniref:DUF4062 domain-containing protein n=1 Tax=Micromonospora zhanjiangensis TaxID=1522057 RepID=A0ABV8KVZ4_9ACTN
MRVFISSVRRELEEERDALPGLISALGHTPVRFEDFTAQTLPSREVCLKGVTSAEVYLLIVGGLVQHRLVHHLEISGVVQVIRGVAGPVETSVERHHAADRTTQVGQTRGYDVVPLVRVP